MNTIKTRSWLWVFAFLFFLSVVPVYAKGAITLSNEVLKEIEVVDANGEKEIKRVPVETALPGSELIYVITYNNTSDEPVSNVVINNPIAAEITYKAKSAQGENTSVLVSVDGGKEYGDLAKLTIPIKPGVTRPAESSDVTHLQFKVETAVKPHEQGTVSFRAILK
ncbi:MAG: hypothetical protein AAB317_03615 [Nitrospirota bacterium]